MTIPMKFLASLVICFPLAAAAQSSDSTAVELDKAIDEITVVGARDLALIRAEVMVAEDAVYSLFNDLNDDDGYDIICKMETRIGSQIPKRVCLARMYRESLAEATVDATDAAGLVVGNMTRNAQQQKILQEKMRALAIEHPELLAALRERYALDQKFKAARDKKYGD